MTSRNVIKTAEPDQHWMPADAGGAVGHLQHGVRTGRPVMIPGALDSAHRSAHRLSEPDGPRGSRISPIEPHDREQIEIEHEAGGMPVAAVTLVGRARSMMMAVIERLIRLLRIEGPRI